MTEQHLTHFLVAHYPKENEGCEWKKMKNLKNDFNGHAKDDVISYVSALSNMDGGDLVIGVTDKTLEIVGISTYNFNVEKARLRLCEVCANLPSEWLEVKEFFTDDTRKTVWVIHVPRHMMRLPVYAHSKAWMRMDDSLVEMTASRLNAILDEREKTYDWTAEVVENASLRHLDSEAIKKAREGYKERYPKLAEAYDGWSDEVVLDKACLTLDGKNHAHNIVACGVVRICSSLKPYSPSRNGCFHKIPEIYLRFTREVSCCNHGCL